MIEKINIKKVVAYWKESAELNFETAQFLFKGKKYSDCLFFCHLTIEKTLKGLVVKKTKKHAPFIHQLIDLAKMVDIPLTGDQIDQLSKITTFNIASRYDNDKLKFYKKCTKEFTAKYLKISHKLYIWLKKKY